MNWVDNKDLSRKTAKLQKEQSIEREHFWAIIFAALLSSEIFSEKKTSLLSLNIYSLSVLETFPFQKENQLLLFCIQSCYEVCISLSQPSAFKKQLLHEPLLNLKKK